MFKKAAKSLIREPSDERARALGTREFALGLDGEDSDGNLNDKNPNDEEAIGGDVPEKRRRPPKTRFKLWRRRVSTMGWMYLLFYYRRVSVTMLEIMIPVLVMLTLVLSITYHLHWELSGRAKIELTEDAKESAYTGGTERRILRRYFVDNEFICHKDGGGSAYHGSSVIIFTPVNQFTKDIMERVAEKLNIINRGFGVDSVMELVRNCQGLYRNRTEENPAPIGIIFKLEMDGGGGTRIRYDDYFDHPISYTIRTFLKQVQNTQELFPYYKALKKEQDISPYVGSGFLGLQSAIDFVYMEMILEYHKRKGHGVAFTEKLRDIVEGNLRPFKYQMFPFPVYLDTKARESTWFLLALAFALSSLFSAFHRSKKIIEDNQSGIIELFKLHGLSTSVNWLGTLFQGFITRFVNTGLVTLILLSSLTNVAFLQYENPGLLWFLLYVHGFAQAAFLHFLSLIFARTKFGALMTTCLGLLTWLIPMSVYVMGFNLGKVFNATLCFLFPNWCLANALYDFLKFESYDRGISYDLLARFADERRIIMPVGACLGLLILSMIAYFFPAVYLDDFQTKQFMPQECKSGLFWLKPKHHPMDEEIGVEDDDDFRKPSVYERSRGTVSIKCRDLSYVANGSIQVLDNVNLNVYEGEVTVFLGNTALEKSTLLRCLGGLLLPTEGTVTLYGTPISGSMAVIQRHVGYSPQFHSFYNYLTVEEHIQVCCLFHGNEFIITKRQCLALLLRLNLFSVRTRSPKNLSEAQKRKLSIAMALANNPKVLILDQPTSPAMDSSEAHEIWTILRGLRKKRTIIATANTMDEAYSYAERIGILSNGRLLSFCPPRYLITALKAGSYVKLKKREDKEVDIQGVIETMEGAVGETVTQVLMKAFEWTDAHAYFSLPAKAQVSHVLRSLEEKQEELGFKTAGITHVNLACILRELTGMEGIEQENVGAFVPEQDKTNLYKNIKIPVQIPTLPPGVRKNPNYASITTALFMKQFHYIRQMVRFFSAGILFPLLMAFILVYLSQIYLWPVRAEWSLLLSTATYPLPNIPVFVDTVGVAGAEDYQKGALSAIGHRADRLVLFGENPQEWDKFQKSLTPSEASMVDYRAQVVMALSIEKGDIKALYASNALHSAPAAQNLLTNLILYILTDHHRLDTNPFRILAYNHPFPDEESNIGGTRGDVANAAIGCILSLIVALLAGAQIGLPLICRITGWQSVQSASGVTPVQHWGVMVVCAAMVNIILAVLLLGVIFLADKTSKGAFQGVDSQSTLFLIILAYLCCSGIPYGYILSKYLVSELSGFGQYIIVHALIGILPNMSMYLLRHSMSWRGRGVIEGFLSLIPPYTMTGALIKYVKLVVEGSYCQNIPLETQQLCELYDEVTHSPSLHLLAISDLNFKSCCDKYCISAGTCYKRAPFLNGKWEMPLNLYTSLFVMLFQGLFYMLVLLVIEYKMMARLIALIQRNFGADVAAARLYLIREVKADTSNQASVQKEVERIEELAESGTHATMSELIYSRGITKMDGRKEVLSHVYFGLPPASVLGITGVVRSGKSLLVRILVGDIRPDAGYSVIKPGLRLSTSRERYLERIGYCPDQSAVLPFLTGFQMMELMGRIRGIPPNYLDIHCRKWLELFRFSDREMDSLTANYENGMKRRLCCAMALLGNPDIVIFDEPTTFMDVISQQIFWSIIQLVRRRGQCVIFTSISGQECFENSTRMILLENGTMKAFGDPDTINELYAPGWTIVVRFRADITSRFSKDVIERKKNLVKDTIEEMYSPCDLDDDDGDLLTYHMGNQSKPLSEMYAIMETLHGGLQDFISGYLIEESSMDDIMGYFGGSRNRQMKLNSLGSDDDSISGTDQNLLGEMDLAELPDESQRWKSQRYKDSSASAAPTPPRQSRSSVREVVQRRMSVMKSIDKLKGDWRRRKTRIGEVNNSGASIMRRSLFSPNMETVQFLQRRTKSVHRSTVDSVKQTGLGGGKS